MPYITSAAVMGLAALLAVPPSGAPGDGGV